MHMRPRFSRSAGVITAAVLAGVLALPAASAAASSRDHHESGRWVATWAASPMPATPVSLAW